MQVRRILSIRFFRRFTFLKGVFMKSAKPILALLLIAGTAASFLPGGGNEALAVTSYECWTHPNGKPDKMVHVLADNRSQAVTLAIEKFRSLDIKPISVTCK
jgi:hypothetical protein